MVGNVDPITKVHARWETCAGFLDRQVFVKELMFLASESLTGRSLKSVYMEFAWLESSATPPLQLC